MGTVAVAARVHRGVPFPPSYFEWQIEADAAMRSDVPSSHDFAVALMMTSAAGAHYVLIDSVGRGTSLAGAQRECKRIV